jgi:predicted PurR-regulated permease PerM
MQPGPVPHQRHIQYYALGIILVVLLVAVLRLLAPVFTAILWSTLLYILLRPLHSRVIRNINFNTLKGKILRNFWAAIFTLGVIVIILFPLTFVATVFFRQIMEMVYYARGLMVERPDYLHDLFERVSYVIRDITLGQIDITADDIFVQVRNFLTNQLQRIMHISGNILRYFGWFSLNMLFIAFAVFFFFVDGAYLARLVLHAIPIKNEYLSTLTTKFMDITRNLFLGYIIVAALQSTIAYIIYTIFGIQGSLVLAVVTFILVFLPMVGATLIWVPLGIFRIASGDIGGGLLFMAVSAVFISGTDNILRPFFLKDRIQLHPLIILFAIFGGLAAFGFNGFVLGPVLVIFFLTVLDIFLAEHKLGQENAETIESGQPSDTA